MNPKYVTLLRILDQLRAEAPDEFKSYKPDPAEAEKLIQARALAFIHLYLLVKCGITDFKARADLICDGAQDGGLDAYHIDQETKRVRLIQAKFRPLEANFENRSIDATELVKMEVGRILRGEQTDSNGVRFNDKILEFQRKRQSIPDIVRYTDTVVILANLTKFNDTQVRKMIDGLDYEVFDYQRSYDELVFPMCSGTYYDPAEILIRIDLSNREQPRLSQSIETVSGHCDITVICVPTIEIGRILDIYKNAILRYNPRSYLSLEQNSVNKKISESITELTTNDFAILNNGITILADSTQISQMTGRALQGQLMLVNPQIINGGQTAYTLSELYRTHPHEIFHGKEVMLKIITLDADMTARGKFIDLVSAATNLQSPVSPADRSSNCEILVKLQQSVYSRFGYFFERKQGEFYNGITAGYIDDEHLIDRNLLIRSFMAYRGRPAKARSQGEKLVFDEQNLFKLIPDEKVFNEVFFAYQVYAQMMIQRQEIRKRKRGKVALQNVFKYGRYAIVAAVGTTNPSVPNSGEEIIEAARKSVKVVLKRWPMFERFAKLLPTNGDYFSRGVRDYDNYYKGNTLDNDIRTFFGADSGASA